MISSAEKKRQIKMIQMQYENFSQKWGHDAMDLFKRFEKRLEDAVNSKSDINIFFQAEHEAIKIFEEKMKEEHGDDDEEDEEEEDEDEKATNEANELAPEKRYDPERMGSFEAASAYTNYNRIKIDLKASSEIEHLFGAMVDYCLIALPALEESRRAIRDKAYHTMVYDIENLLTDLGDNQNGRIPSIFSNYKNEIARARGTEELERARLAPFKATVNVVRKIKRLGRWVENHHLKLPSHVRLKYNEEECSLQVFADKLVNDMLAIIKSFGLQEFLN